MNIFYAVSTLFDTLGEGAGGRGKTCFASDKIGFRRVISRVEAVWHSLLSSLHYCHLMAIVPVIVICYPPPPSVIGEGKIGQAVILFCLLGCYIKWLFVVALHMGLGCRRCGGRLIIYGQGGTNRELCSHPSLVGSEHQSTLFLVGLDILLSSINQVFLIQFKSNFPLAGW